MACQEICCIRNIIPKILWWIYTDSPITGKSCKMKDHIKMGLCKNFFNQLLINQIALHKSTVLNGIPITGRKIIYDCY